MSVHASGECEKHNLEWYDKGVIDCPVCVADTELAALRAENAALKQALQAASELSRRRYAVRGRDAEMSEKRNEDKVKELIKNISRETDPYKLDVYADILQEFGRYDEASKARSKAKQERERYTA